MRLMDMPRSDSPVSRALRTMVTINHRIDYGCEMAESYVEHLQRGHGKHPTVVKKATLSDSLNALPTELNSHVESCEQTGFNWSN